MKPINGMTGFFKTSLQRWLWLSRRNVLMGGGTCVACLLTLDWAYADSEFRIEVSPQEDVENSQVREEQEHNFESRQRNQEEVGLQLGIEYRAPTCGMQNLTPIQLLATRTPEKAPGYLSVGAKYYFSDDPSRSFSDDAGSCLISATRKIEEVQIGASIEPMTNPPINDNLTLKFPYGVAAVAAGPQGELLNSFLKSVEWTELLSATVEKAVDVAESAVVEDIAKRLTGVAEGPAFVISTLVDVMTPTPLWEPELTYWIG